MAAVAGRLGRPRPATHAPCSELRAATAAKRCTSPNFICSPTCLAFIGCHAHQPLMLAEFKGAKKMAHRRPKKRCPADKRHGPAVYPEAPAPPPQYTVISQ